MRAVLIAAMLIGLSGTVAAAQPSPNPAAERQAIERLLEEFSAAFNGAEAERVVQLFSPQADAGTTRGRLVPHAELEKWLAGEFTGPDGPRTIQLSMTAVRWVTPDLAILDGTWTETTPGPHGRVTPPARMHVVAVVIKKDGRWLFDALRRFSAN